MVESIQVAYRHKGKHYPLEFHTHRHDEIYLFHQGNCRFLIGDHMYMLKPGDLLFIDGKTVHRAALFSDADTYERSIIHFDRDWLMPLLRFLDLEDLLSIFQENKQGRLRVIRPQTISKVEELLKRLTFLAAVDDHDKHAEQQLVLVDLLLSVKRGTERILDKPNMRGDEKTAIAERVSKFIAEHYRESLSIERIANEVNLSKSYLSHVFKDISGQTIMQYIMGYRLSQATHALESHPEYTIKHISKLHGFESDAHFSRYFKAHFKVTPSRYRKQLNNHKGEYML
ncbi:MAG: helix-turn-helix domain-containing protein [Bacillota bacterium]